MASSSFNLDSPLEKNVSSADLDPHWRRRSVVQVLILVLALMSIALFAAAIPLWNANFFHSIGPNVGDWTDGIVIGPLAFIFLKSLINLTSTCLLHQKPRPGALRVQIFLSLITLLAFPPCVLLAIYGSLFLHWKSAVYTSSGLLVCNLTNVFSRQCQPILYQVGQRQIAGVVLACLVWLLESIVLLFLLSDNRRLKDRSWSKDSERRGTRRHRHHHHHHHRRDYSKHQRHRGQGNGNLPSRYENETYGESSIANSSDVVPIYYIEQPVVGPTFTNNRYA